MALQLTESASPTTTGLATTMTNDRKDTISMLLIEDSDSDARLIKAHLDTRRNPSFRIHHETTLEAGIQRLRKTAVDITVIDLSLPDSTGLDTFRRVREPSNHVPIVVLSGMSDEQVALEAVREGAQGFLSKNEVIHESLGRTLQHAIEQFHRQKAEREIDAAGFIQRRLYPKPLPPLENLDVAGRCAPANQVGGDYFDYFMVDERNLILVIGDVSGHGFGPSLVMAETRAALRTMAAMTDDVRAILNQANELLCNDDTHTFVTLFMARLDVRNGNCTYASAGHQAELLRADRSHRTLVTDNLPLGIQSYPSVDARELQLMNGDTLLLHTDGISERMAPNNEQFGVERIIETIISAANLNATTVIDQLFDNAMEYGSNLPPVDDMSAIMLKVTAPLDG